MKNKSYIVLILLVILIAIYFTFEYKKNEIAFSDQSTNLNYVLNNSIISVANKNIHIGDISVIVKGEIKNKNKRVEYEAYVNGKKILPARNVINALSFFHRQQGGFVVYGNVKSKFEFKSNGKNALEFKVKSGEREICNFTTSIAQDFQCDLFVVGREYLTIKMPKNIKYNVEEILSEESAIDLMELKYEKPISKEIRSSGIYNVDRNFSVDDVFEFDSVAIIKNPLLVEEALNEKNKNLFAILISNNGSGMLVYSTPKKTSAIGKLDARTLQSLRLNKP